MNILNDNRCQKNPFKQIRTKLDEMASAEAKGLLTSGGSIISDLPEREGNISDDSVSSGDGTRFKNRMGVFDFPDTFLIHLKFPKARQISQRQSNIHLNMQVYLPH